MYFIPQITSNDCLFTAFKILLANVKNDEKYLYLQEDEKHGNYSFLEIIEKAKSYGMELFGFECEDKEELKRCKDVPVILNLKKGENALHSVYVYKIKNEKVYYLDSDIGNVVMKFNQFVSLWDGTGLMMKRCNDTDYEISTPIVNIKKNVVGKITQILSAIFFVFGIYFIDDTTNVILPMCFILFGVLFEILTKVIQIKDMKRFDNQSLYLLNKVSKKNLISFLPRREKLKMSFFSGQNNQLFYSLCCGFVVFIILLNNPYNVACAFMPIILSLIDSLVIVPLEKKKNIEIEQMEVKFATQKNSSFAAKTLSEIHDQAYKFSGFVLLKKGVGIILLFLAAFFTLHFAKAFDLVNILFLLFTEIFLYQNLTPIFSFERRKMEEKTDYMRFINLLQ